LQILETEFDVIGASPMGLNINEGVWINTSRRSCKILACRKGADAGLAFDWGTPIAIIVG